jgi:hypothetical protein
MNPLFWTTDTTEDFTELQTLVEDRENKYLLD